MNVSEAFDESELRRALNVARAGDVVFLQAVKPISKDECHAIQEHAASITEGTGVKVVFLCDKLLVDRIDQGEPQ